MSFEDWIKAEATSNKHRTEVWDQGTDREKTVEEDYYYLGTLSGPLPKSFVSQCNTWQGEVHYYWFYVRHVTSITPDTYNEIGEWRIFYGEPGKGVYNRRVSPTSVYWTNELYSLLKYFKN
ncbi:hypothetical protein FACS189483_05880 [Spirochaetia bacterium]|nr:hypothetical protein FACS189483_05880 [Spirochaetia bacterium]